MEAKILLWDTEVSRSVVEGYGTKWEYKVVKVVRPQKLMCYAYKWLNDGKTKFVSMHDFDSYHAFVQSLADLLSEADITIAHNGDNFDNKMSNTFFIQEGIRPPSPRKSIDTVKVARSVFKFPSNSLRDLGESLGLGTKEKITYADLEDDFMSSNPSRYTKRMMSKYTRTDVDLLERIYLTLRPYMKSHPNLSAYRNGAFCCTYCGSSSLRVNKHRTFNTGTYLYYLCNNCGHYPRERLADKEYDRAALV